MAWNTRGLRGNTLEEFINYSNNVYREKGLGIIQKIPTPITPVKISSDRRNITLAYFDGKSTVDYIGAVQGIPICFDAKETCHNYLPMQNIHEHQIKFMRDFSKQKGASFLIVYFSAHEEIFLFPFEELDKWYSESLNGGRKSIPYSAFSQEYRIYNKNGIIAHYLEPLNRYLIKLGI